MAVIILKQKNGDKKTKKDYIELSVKNKIQKDKIAEHEKKHEELNTHIEKKTDYLTYSLVLNGILILAHIVRFFI